MKTNYFYSLILGIICFTSNISLSQNILFDGDFSTTTEIIPFDSPTPPLNTWAFWLNSVNDAEAYPTIVEGVCVFQIANPGYETLDVQLAQWGFPLIQGHLYQLMFDVRADAERNIGVFLGENGGDYTSLIGFDRYFYYATTDWQTISIDFEATSVFDLHKLSFELGTDNTTTYFDNVILQDLGPAPSQKIVIAGTFQSALNCPYDWDPNCDYTELDLNSSTGLYTGTFQIPEGKQRYKVTVGGSWDISYGENGILNGPDIFLCLPSGSEEITFTYDPSTNLVTTSPISSGFSPDCLPLVVLAGSFQDELGCYSDWVGDCTDTALIYNSDSGLFEADFNIPTGCYEYRVVLENSWENSFGQDGIHNGPNYSISIPVDPEITHFTYDPVSHIVTSTPYSAVPQELAKVSLLGTLQDELGCSFDYEFECDNPALEFNPDSGAWEGSFMLPAGCYNYLVKETIGCNNAILYGENGMEWGNEIQLYVPTDAEITFSYDPQTHIMVSAPYSSSSLEVTKVSLIGSLQDELGCALDYEFECNNPALVFNPDSGAWEGSFMLPAGCYNYLVKETIGCNNAILYGENGMEWGNEIQIYIPTEAEITFSYDPQTHIISSTPYSDTQKEITGVSLVGSLQDELGCGYDYDYECDNPALVFNPDSGFWEGNFMLPSGCYTFLVKETSVCNIIFYGEEGMEWGNENQLYIPSDAEITFSYDPETHIITSTPYSGAPQEATKISLLGTFQDELGCSYDYEFECDNPALQFNSDLNIWEGNFTLPAGCYTYQVKETIGCNNIIVYGENGIEWGDDIQLYIPTDSEITFSYDPQTHIISSTPYGGAPQEVMKVSLIGNLQDESGCAYDNDYECENPALLFNPESGNWEGNFTLPSGCYTYQVKETFGCNQVTIYGENGIEWGNEIQLYIPIDTEITFSYDSQTHIISSAPYSGAPQEVMKVSLIGSLQDESGCAYDYDYECEKPTLLFNPESGNWEGSLMLPSGCYTYQVKETFGCNQVTIYGENGNEWGNEIQFYVPSDTEITFSYDPQTHIISSTPDIPTLIQCPETITVNNSPGSCGAIVNYPEFEVTTNCGGEIISITQTEGLPSGSFFPVGTTANSFILTKVTGDEITCSFDVVVMDTESPIISDLNQIYEPLSPTNHKMVPVFIEYFALDNCDVASTELFISSNEPENGFGDGDKAPDWEIQDEHNVLLRAERSGKGDGREYYITIKVMDDSGNYTEESVTVKVLHDNGTEVSNNKYILYPNGADDIINIKGPKSSSNQPYVIYDLLGIIIKQGNINNDQIDVEALPSGIYILKFEMDKDYIFKKFIKN